MGHGADRGRTDNLLDATEALSQLSYGPNSGSGLVPANHRGTAKCTDLPGGRPEPIAWPGGRFRGSPSGAGRAAAGERQFVVLELESLGEELLEAAGTARDVVDAVADRAVEVVVVGGGDAGELVTVRPARDRDRGDLVVLLKPSDHAVDRPHAQTRNGHGGFLVDLLDRERAARILDRGSDRLGLPGGALLGHGGLVPKDSHETIGCQQQRTIPGRATP